LTKDKGDIFHLLAGTGNIQIMDLILKKEILPYTSHDKFKKTPPMIAIRNNNNECLVRLIENGCKLEKVDSSLNTLLHYAAAYGNIEAIHILKDRIEQSKNKRGMYPW
jgi:ankyrin repeat protein